MMLSNTLVPRQAFLVKEGQKSIRIINTFANVKTFETTGSAVNKKKRANRIVIGNFTIEPTSS